MNDIAFKKILRIPLIIKWKNLIILPFLLYLDSFILLSSIY